MRTHMDKMRLDSVRLAHIQSLHPFRLFSVLKDSKEEKDTDSSYHVTLRRRERDRDR